MVEAGSVAVRSRESVVGIDALGTDAELFKSGLLSGEVLLVAGATGVADCDRRHAVKRAIKVPLLK